MSNISKPHLILPAGTQIVTLVDCKGPAGEPVRQSGTVGKIVKSPTDAGHAYLVQFPDGHEAVLNRHEIAIRKQVQAVNFDRGGNADDMDLERYIIFRCVVGSRAFGLDVESSDTDRRGIYLPPARLHWSLYGLPEQIGDEAKQECFWELQKFLVLALKANPNVLECLYTPLIEEASPVAEELLAEKERLLSKLVFQTYNGYVLSQFKKLEQDLRTRGELKWKHVMHLVRLLASGIAILKDGVVPVRVVEHRERLLAIRSGTWAWEEVNEWRLDLHRQFAEAYEHTSLPERPDYEWADEFLVRARRTMVE